MDHLRHVQRGDKIADVKEDMIVADATKAKIADVDQTNEATLIYDPFKSTNSFTVLTILESRVMTMTEPRSLVWNIKPMWMFFEHSSELLLNFSQVEMHEIAKTYTFVVTKV